jgi:hypothetical protein
MGTTATSRPLSELDSWRSAADSSSHGTMTSATDKATTHRQRGRSARSRPRRTAAGSNSKHPMNTRVNTRTETETPPSATLINRYGMPQITPTAANSAQPRRLTVLVLAQGARVPRSGRILSS